VSVQLNSALFPCLNPPVDIRTAVVAGVVARSRHCTEAVVGEKWVGSRRRTVGAYPRQQSL
jgi:hypothetical protein